MFSSGSFKNSIFFFDCLLFRDVLFLCFKSVEVRLGLNESGSSGICSDTVNSLSKLRLSNTPGLILTSSTTFTLISSTASKLSIENLSVERRLYSLYRAPMEDFLILSFPLTISIELLRSSNEASPSPQDPRLPNEFLLRAGVRVIFVSRICSSSMNKCPVNSVSGRIGCACVSCGVSTNSTW
uniref:Uncharacterized protein n=1 Tax=Cacopsylla melanoneura TaxID=428564 RepID=A0A8D8TL82_9HEMI